MKKEIMELKDIHKGCDIWIIASGASMDFIDPSFFEGKITMGVNNVYIKFKCDYLIWKQQKGMRAAYETGSKLIISKYDCGNKRVLNEIGEMECWVFEHLANKRSIINFSIVGTDKIIVSYSTITSAIHIAAYIGAKNIILCGHECGVLDNKNNFAGYYGKFRKKRSRSYSYWLKGIASQTIKVREKIREIYDCNIYSLNPFIGLDLEGHKFDG